MDVLIPGHYFCDVIFTGLSVLPSLSTEIYSEKLTVTPGGVLNTVVGFHRLEMKAGWVGALGNDFFSRFVRQYLEKEGLDLSLVQNLDAPLQRITVSLSYPIDRAFVSYVDEGPDEIEMVLNALETTTFRHLHFTGLEVDERMPALLANCHARGIIVSMDCQHRQETLVSPLVREILGHLDIFMPNACEARSLTGTETMQEAADVLNEVVPCLVIRDGASGAYAWQDGQRFYAPAIPVNAVDTTGAGDVFNAGFVTAHLRGNDTQTCLEWGNICGGLCTQGYGGVESAPTLAQVQAFLAEK